jgi:hypothetical protein
MIDEENMKNIQEEHEKRKEILKIETLKEIIINLLDKEI